MYFSAAAQELIKEQSCSFDYDAADGIEPEDTSKRMQEFVKQFICFLRASPRKALTIDCLFLAVDDAIMDGATLTSVAKRHGVTKQAISIRIKEIQRKLDLRPSRSQKSKQASKSYDLSNWRPKVSPE